MQTDLNTQPLGPESERTAHRQYCPPTEGSQTRSQSTQPNVLTALHLAHHQCRRVQRPHHPVRPPCCACKCGRVVLHSCSEPASAAVLVTPTGPVPQGQPSAVASWTSTATDSRSRAAPPGAAGGGRQRRCCRIYTASDATAPFPDGRKPQDGLDEEKEVQGRATAETLSGW